MNRSRLTLSASLALSGLLSAGSCGGPPDGGTSGGRDDSGGGLPANLAFGSAGGSGGSGPSDDVEIGLRQTCDGPAHLVAKTSGPSLRDARVLPVFWGSDVASDTKASIGIFLALLKEGLWANLLRSEYGAGLSPRSPITITPHVARGSTVTDPDIQAELAWQRSNGGLPDDLPYFYVIHFPPTVTPRYDAGNGLQNACEPSGRTYWCAYHNVLATSLGPALYAVIPDHTQGACAVNFCAAPVQSSLDAMLVAASHEIANALTDPDSVNGFRTNPNDTGCAGREIADLCAGQAITITDGINAAKVQSLWSNRGNRCLAVPGALGDVNGDHRSDLVLTGGPGWTMMPVAFSNGFDGSYWSTSYGPRSKDPKLEGPPWDTGFPVYAQQAPATPVSGDFDGDGRADIALTGNPHWNTIPIAYSLRDPGWFRGTNAGVTSGDAGFSDAAAQPGARPVAGDFDGDGLADIAIVGGVDSDGQPWPTIPLALSNGADGTFHGLNKGVTTGDTYFTTYAAQAGATPVSGDFNCDGYADIALTGGLIPNGDPWTTIPIAFSNGDGTFWALNATINVDTDTGFPTYATQGARPVAGDFDGDCFADIALVGGPGWSTLPVAHFKGAEFFATNAGVTTGDTGFPDYAAQMDATPIAGDFDGDGYSDIALTGGVDPYGRLWTTMPIAFSTGADGTFRGTNAGVTAGDPGFPDNAGQTGATPVSR
jgi:hypothetical protein